MQEKAGDLLEASHVRPHHSHISSLQMQKHAEIPESLEVCLHSQANHNMSETVHITDR